MRILFFLSVLLIGEFGFCNVLSWKEIIKTEGAKSWVATTEEKIQLTLNEIDAADAKPTSSASAKSYIEQQEFWRSWTNRFMGVSQFKIREHKWDPITNKLTFSGDYLNGTDKVQFREVHEFKEKIYSRQMVWPASLSLKNEAVDELWKLEP